jgi:hypothetical protein
MNSKRTRICSVLLGLVAYTMVIDTASAGFPSLPGLPSAGKSSVGPIDPDTFLQTAKEAEWLLGQSLSSMSMALLSKEQVAVLKAQQQTADAITDPKEKEAKNLEIMKSTAAQVNEAAADAGFSNSVGRMDSDKRAQLGNSAYNFMLGVLKQVVLEGQSKGLISGITSNPANIAKLGSVKDAASSIGKQLSITATLASKMPAVFSTVGVKSPLSADEKPKVVTLSNTES